MGNYIWHGGSGLEIPSVQSTSIPLLFGVTHNPTATLMNDKGVVLCQTTKTAVSVIIVCFL